MTLDEHRKLSVLIEKIGRTDDLSAPARVESALLGELRRRRRRAIALRVAAPLALAAGVLIALLLAPKPEQQAPSPAPVAAVIAPAPQAIVAAPPVLPKPRVARARRVVPAPRMADTGFLPVGVWQVAEPIERGSIMRVKLPRSAMNDFGFPVSMERWHEQIPADVMLAEDGSVRAVRFISPMQ